MKKVELPSGKTVLNILDDATPTQASYEGIESTSGTLSLDLPNQCPKCGAQMVEATANSEAVFWCNSCRVTAPMSVTE